MIDRYDPDLLLAYIEDELEGQALARFEKMMQDDAQLATLMRGLTSDRATLRSLPDEDTPAGLVDDALHQLERTMLLDGPAQNHAGPIPIQRRRELTAPIPGRPWGRIVGISGLAAAVMIGAGLTYYVLLDDPLNRTALEMMQENQSPGSPTTADDSDAGFASAEEANRDRLVGDSAPGSARNTTNESTAPRPGGPGGLAERGVPQPLEAPMPEGRESSGNGGLLDRAADAILAGPLAPERAENPPSAIEPVRDPARTTEPGARPDNRPPAIAPVIALARNGQADFDAPSQLLVYTDSPEMTQQQLLAWCVSNGIPVVETDQLVGHDANPAVGLDDGLAGRRDAQAKTQLALLIEDQQLGELVSVMNRIEVPRLNRQRAVLNHAQADPQQRAQVRQQTAPAEPGPLQYAQADEAQDYYQLKAPSDLGDDRLTDQNFDNVYRYNNRIATEGGYGQTPQAGPAPAAPAPPNATPMAAVAEQAEDADNAAADPALAEAEGQALAGGNGPPAAAQADAQDPAQPGDMPADELTDVQGDAQARRVTQRDTSNAPTEEADRPRRAAPRGNHLMPQLPLANTTPIWSEPSQTRIVPVILRLAGADAIESLDAPAAEAAQQTDTAEGAAKTEAEAETETEAAEDAETQAGDTAVPADE